MSSVDAEWIVQVKGAASFDPEWVKLGSVQVKGVLSLANEYVKPALFQVRGAGSFDAE